MCLIMRENWVGCLCLWQVEQENGIKKNGVFHFRKKFTSLQAMNASLFRELAKVFKFQATSTKLNTEIFNKWGPQVKGKAKIFILTIWSIENVLSRELAVERVT